jgi:hypothetical protein
MDELRASIGNTGFYVRVLLPLLLTIGVVFGIGALRRGNGRLLLIIDGLAFTLLLPAIDRAVGNGSAFAQIALISAACLAALAFVIGSRSGMTSS